MNTRKLIVATAVAGLGLAAPAATVKVDASGAWEGSVKTLAEAFVQHAADGDVILVRPGSYAVSAPLEVRYANLTLTSCGEDGLPDAAGTVIDANGACRILTASGAGKGGLSVVGFTLRKGAATGSDADGRGGAVSLDGSGAFEIRDCVIEGGSATTGGGLGLNNVSGLVSNCVVRGNAAATGAGVAVTYPLSNVAFADCVISNNTATVPSGAGWQNTGAAVSSEGFLTMTRCTVADNAAVNAGGTVVGGHLALGGATTFAGCTVRAEATAGGYGAVAYLSGAAAQVYSNCTFDVSGAAGAFGLLNLNGDGKAFVGCTFATSGAAPDTALVYALNSGGHLFRNCRFTGLEGSAPVFQFNIQNAEPRTLTVENCTFANNATRQVTFGGGANLSATFVNSILMGTVDGANANVFSNCCLSAAVAGATVVDCVYAAPPGFRRVADGDWRLRSDSPCRDKGLRLGWMDGEARDLGGRPRVVGAAPDIGCHERQDDETDVNLRVVADAADRTGDWADAYTDLQAAVDAAQDEDTVLVRSGRYALAETVRITNKTVTVRSCSPATGLADPEGTVLDGGGTVSALRIEASELADDATGFCGVLATAHHPVVVEGFTFTNCFSEADGGAVWLQGEAPEGLAPAKIVNCAFLGNAAKGGGGGLCIFVAGEAVGCTFRGNRAEGRGGAVRISSKRHYSWNVRPGWELSEAGSWYWPVVRDCTVEGNEAADGGGGVFAAVNALLVGCTVADNRAGGATATYGGGLWLEVGSQVRDCVIRGNAFGAAGGYGSGLFCAASPLVSNAVVAANGTAYGAFYAEGADVRVYDSVLTNNACDAAWCGKGTFRQCLFAHNARAAVGAFNPSDATLTLESCTLADNAKGAVAARYAAAGWTHAFALVDCIVHGNGGGTFLSIAGTAGQSVALTNVLCDAAIPADAAFAAENVFSGAPRFVDAAAGDYRLKAGSAAREKAAWADWMAGASDLGGQPRVVDLLGRAFADGALPDCGCYEAQDAKKGLAVIVR